MQVESEPSSSVESNRRGKRRAWGTASVFLLIALLWLKLLWYDGLQRQAALRDWLPVDAVVIATEIHYVSAYAEYQLSGTFAVNWRTDAEQTFEKFLNAGKIGQVERIAERDYPAGKTITVYRNPANPEEFDLGRERPIGPWVIGFLPGLFIGCIGLSTLRLGAGTSLSAH